MFEGIYRYMIYVYTTTYMLYMCTRWFAQICIYMCLFSINIVWLFVSLFVYTIYIYQYIYTNICTMICLDVCTYIYRCLVSLYGGYVTQMIHLIIEMIIMIYWTNRGRDETNTSKMGEGGTFPLSKCCYIYIFLGKVSGVH